MFQITIWCFETPDLWCIETPLLAPVGIQITKTLVSRVTTSGVGCGALNLHSGRDLSHQKWMQLWYHHFW